MTYYSNNKEHVSKIQKAYWNKTKKDRDAMLNTLKINGCSICGYDECKSALHFHHVNSKTKLFNLRKNDMKRKDVSIIKEMNKCILLCANCHTAIEEISRRNVRW